MLTEHLAGYRFFQSFHNSELHTKYLPFEHRAVNSGCGSAVGIDRVKENGERYLWFNPNISKTYKKK